MLSRPRCHVCHLDSLIQQILIETKIVPGRGGYEMSKMDTNLTSWRPEFSGEDSKQGIAARSALLEEQSENMTG